MKRNYLYTLIFASIALTSNSQTIDKLLTDGKSWEVVYTNANPMTPWEKYKPCTVTVCGDTIVDNLSCKKICTTIKGEDVYEAAYEENGKIYGFDENEEPYLMLDFNLHKGDFCSDDRFSTFIEEDYIEVHGVTRRRLKTSISTDEGDVYWVEGIGASHDFWYTEIPRHIGEYSYMVACYDNGELIFSREDFSKDSITGINATNIHSDNEECGRKFGLNGTVLRNTKKGEVYIQNKEKHIDIR